MTIPRDDQGYAIDRATGTVHRRYANHARGMPRSRTLEGALQHVEGQAIPCRDCYGGPVHRDPSPVRERGPVVFIPPESGVVIPVACPRCGTRHKPGSRIYTEHMA